MMKKYDFQDILCHFYAVFVTLVTFGMYVKTLAPTVSFFDSGELISAAYTLGVAHPPGYPLYVLLGWFFSKLPIGNIAYRINLMSAFFASLAVLMVYYITYTIIVQRRRTSTIDNRQSQRPDPERMLYPVISMIAALMFAFSITHWRHALIAEVYSLNAFLCGLIVLLLVKWYYGNKTPGVSENSGSLSPPLAEETPPLVGGDRGGGKTATPKHSWLLYLTAFIFGLGFGNHQTISLLFFTACFLVLITVPRIMLRVKTLVFIVLFLLLGLSIYGLVPIRATQKPPINWGNAVTWWQFKWLVTREGYQNVPRGYALKMLWDDLVGKENPPQSLPGGENGKGIARIYHVIRTSLFLKQLLSFNPLREFGYIGAILAILGMLYSLIFHRAIGFTLLIAVLSMVIIIVIIGDPPEENIFLVEEFHTPSYLLVAVWIGVGAMAITQVVLWVASGNRIVQYGMVFGLAVCFLAPPGVQMWGTLATVDRSRNYVAYDYGTNILNSLKPNAILFTWGDSGAFPLWYLQIVEKTRLDVTLIHVPHLGTDWYVELLPQDLFISADPYHKYGGEIFPIIDEIVHKHSLSRPVYFDYSSSHSTSLPYQLIPHGITYKVAIPGDILDEEVWDRYRFRGILDNTRIALDPDVRRTFLMYGSAQIELGNFYLDLGQVEKAADAFNTAVRFDPSLGDGIVRMLQFRDKMLGGHIPDASDTGQNTSVVPQPQPH